MSRNREYCFGHNQGQGLVEVAGYWSLVAVVRYQDLESVSRYQDLMSRDISGV